MKRFLKRVFPVVIGACVWTAGNLLVSSTPAKGQDQEVTSTQLGCIPNTNDIDGPYNHCSENNIPGYSDGYCARVVWKSYKCKQLFGGNPFCDDTKPMTTYFEVQYSPCIPAQTGYVCPTDHYNPSNLQYTKISSSTSQRNTCQATYE